MTQKIENKVLRIMYVCPSLSCTYSIVTGNAIVRVVVLPLSHSKWSFITLMRKFGNYYANIWSIPPKLFEISLTLER